MAVVINGTTGIDTIQDGTVSTAKIVADAVTTPKIADTVNLGRRNLIINGAMQVAQRGTDTSVTSSRYCGPDRWQLEVVDNTTLTVEQSTDAPNGFGYSYKITVTTADTSYASSEWLRVAQRIEGQNLQHLSWGTADAKDVTLSFWVKSSITGTYTVALQHADATQMMVRPYTINSANTWEYKTLTYDGNTSNGFDNDINNSLRPFFFLAAGSARTTDDNASGSTWVTDNTANNAYGQTANVATTTNATWQFTGVQMETGNTATPFEHRSYGEELSLCQRYYNYHPSGSMNIHGFRYNSTVSLAEVNFPTTMRVAPTVVAINGQGSTTDTVTSVMGFTRAYDDSDNNFIDSYTADAEL